MAKKEDNFDFETEGKAKGFDLSFLKDLTKQQKGIILIAAVAIVLVIAIVITCVIIGANGGFGGNSNNNSTGGATSDGLKPEEVTGISIATAPNKVEYFVGDAPDYTGLSVTLSSGRGSERRYYDYNPEVFTITGFDSSEVNEALEVTVEVNGYKTSFTVKIQPVPEVGVTLVGITLKSLPTKTNYVLGDVFDPRGGVILAEYSDGTTVEVELQRNNVSGFSYIETPGEHTLIIKYFDDNGGYAETTLTITVTE